MHASVWVHHIVPALAHNIAKQPDEMKKWIAEEEVACAENNLNSRSS